MITPFDTEIIKKKISIMHTKVELKGIKMRRKFYLKTIKVLK
jgi:hypothetical protein